MDNSGEIDRAQRILSAERALWPLWRRPGPKPAPGWFSGGELDVLMPEERDDLYRRLRSDHRASWVAVAVALPGLPRMMWGTHSPVVPWLGLACVLFFVASLVAGVLFRRHKTLSAARRAVRESPDWPLRALHLRP